MSLLAVSGKLAGICWKEQEPLLVGPGYRITGGDLLGLHGRSSKTAYELFPRALMVLGTRGEVGVRLGFDSNGVKLESGASVSSSIPSSAGDEPSLLGR